MNNKKKRRRLLIFPVIAIICFGIYALMDMTKPLPKLVVEVEETTEEEKVPLSIVHPLTDIDFSLYVPTDAQKVVDGDACTFYMSDKINVMVEKLSKNYSIWTKTADEYKSELSGDISILSYTFPTTSSRLTSYVRIADGKQKVNVEYSVWNLDLMLRVSYEVDADKYDEYVTVIKKSIDMCEWNCNNKIPDYLIMQHASFGNFDYAIPYNYKPSVSEAGKEITYVNNEGTIAYSLAVVQDSTMLGDITNLTYANYTGNGKSNYALKNFSVSNTLIYAESSYTTSNGTQMYMYQNIVANGKYQYYVTFYFQKSVLTEENIAMMDEINSFIKFY